jgi:hypothetical protein
MNTNCCKYRFVECAQPLASSVDFDLELRVRTCLTLTFSGVPNRQVVHVIPNVYVNM